MKCSEEICEVYEICRWRDFEMCTDYVYGYSGQTVVSLSKKNVEDMEVRICGRYKKAKVVEDKGNKRSRLIRLKGI